MLLINQVVENGTDPRSRLESRWLSDRGIGALTSAPKDVCLKMGKCKGNEKETEQFWEFGTHP